MNKMKLKEASFLGVALAMTASGFEVPANAVELPKTGSGITMNDFGQIEGFGTAAAATDADGVVAQKSSSKKGSKKGCSKKGVVCGTSTGGDYGTSTSGGSSKKGTKKGCSKKGVVCGTTSGGYTSTSTSSSTSGGTSTTSGGGSTTSTSGGTTTTTSGGGTTTSGGGTTTSGGGTTTSGGTPVPEPSMLGLFALGAGAAVWGRRKRKAKLAAQQ